MKILWVSHLIPYPPKAGVLIRSYHLIRELSKHHDVDLLMLNQPRLLGDYFDSQQQGIEAANAELQTFVTAIELEAIPAEQSKFSRMLLITKSFFSTNSYTMNWLRGSNIRKRLADMITTGDYDLIHFDTISLDIFRDLVPSQTPLIMDHHNIESHMMQRRAQKERSVFRKLYFSWEYKKLVKYEIENLPHYDANIVCSKDDKDRLLDLLPKTEVEVIPNGISVTPTPPKRNPVPGKLLFIGGMSWYPNEAAVSDFIANIAPVLRERGIDFTLDIVGSNPSKELLASAEPWQDIIFHGFVDSISAFYEQASAFVCPINDGGGTKLKVLDALANRVPLIGYPLACEGIEITNNEHAVVVSNQGEFADAVADFIRDPERAQEIADNGRALIERDYEYTEIGNKLSRYYTVIAKRKSANGGVS